MPSHVGTRFTCQCVPAGCSALDVDGSHRVSYTEFLAAALQRKNYLRVDRIREAFER